MIPGIVADVDVAPIFGPPQSWSPQPVIFSSAQLVCSSVSCTNNQFFGFAGWFKSSNWASGQIAWASDPGPSGNYNNWLMGGGTCEFGVGSTTNFLTKDFTQPDSAWHHIMGAARTNSAAGAKTMVIYIDDVLITPTGTGDTDTSFTIIGNGAPFWFGNDYTNTHYYAGSMMDVSIWPGIDLMQGGSTISSTVRQYFTDTSGAVDPAVAVAALGHPAIFCSGDAVNFRLNTLGTSGALTIASGTLTDDPSPP